MRIINQLLQIIGVTAADSAVGQDQPAAQPLRSPLVERGVALLSRVMQLPTNLGLRVYSGRVQELTHSDNPFRVLPGDVLNLILEQLSPSEIRAFFAVNGDMRTWREEFLTRSYYCDMISTYVIKHLDHLDSKYYTKPPVVTDPLSSVARQRTLMAQIKRQGFSILDFACAYGGELRKIIPLFPRLQHVSIRKEIYSTDLECISRLTELQSFTITSCYQINDTLMPSLCKLPRLRSLTMEVEDPRASMAEFESLHYLSRLTALQYLNLNNQQSILDRDIRAIRGLTQLQALHLSRCSHIHADIVQHLTNLQELGLAGNDTVNSALPYITHLTKLQFLDLYSCQITDVGLQYIGTLVQLTTLILGQGYGDKEGAITDTGLRHLSGLTNLQALNLHFQKKISGEGVKAVISCLTQLHTLQLTRCDGVQPSEELVSYLSKLQDLSLP